MLYPNFLGSRQIGLPGFQLVRGLPHRNTSLDYSCTASVYSTPTTRILLLTSLWWYTATIVDDVRLHQQNHFCRKESACPVSRISLSLYHCISAGLKIHLHWVNHVWTDRIGIEPIIAVLETAVFPIKLSIYGVIGSWTQTNRVKVCCSTIELLPNKAADRSRTGNLL